MIIKWQIQPAKSVDQMPIAYKNLLASVSSYLEICNNENYDIYYTNQIIINCTNDYSGSIKDERKKIFPEVVINQADFIPCIEIRNGVNNELMFKVWKV